MSERPEGRDPEADPPEPDGGDSATEGGSGDEESLPSSPFDTETIEFMVGVEDEVLAVRLGGVAIGQTRIGMNIAGPFLFRLNTLVHAIATSIVGREGGRRGTLPGVEGAGLLALAGVQWGHSVTFHFGLGPGEALPLLDPSITTEAVGELADLLEPTATKDDRVLFDRIRELGLRVGTDYVSVINVLNQHNVDAYWRVREREPIALTVPLVRRAKTVLDRADEPKTLVEEVEGLLYRADSKEHQFILEPIDHEETKIVGTYDPALREEIRDAWDKLVRVRLRTTHYFLARQVDPAEVTVELLEVLDAREP